MDVKEEEDNTSRDDKVCFGVKDKPYNQWEAGLTVYFR